MGNALVVEAIERIGIELSKQLKGHSVTESVLY
jgi:hypothetical protein